MKTLSAIKAGLTGLAAITLSYIVGGCTTGETLKGIPDYLTKYSNIRTTAKKEAAPKPGPSLEKKVEKESQKSRIDVSDTEFSLIKIRNNHPVNVLLTGGERGGWDHEERETKNVANAGAKVLLRHGDARAFAAVQDFYTTANANPDDQEDEDMHANIAQLLFGGGGYAGSKNAEVYGEVRAGWEDVKLSGVVDGWAQDLLVGAKIGFSSESAKLLGMLNISTNLGVFDGVGTSNITNLDRYDLEIGADNIPVSGEYGRVTGAITLQKGVDLPYIGELFLVAKGSAMYEHFENFAKFNTYTVSLGVDKRLKLADSNVEALIGVEAFGRKKITDFVRSSSEQMNEYGLLARMQVEVAKGIYADVYGMVTREFNHGQFEHAEFEAGAQLTLIPGDILDYFTKDEKKD